MSVGIARTVYARRAARAKRRRRSPAKRSGAPVHARASAPATIIARSLESNCSGSLLRRLADLFIRAARTTQ